MKRRSFLGLLGLSLVAPRVAAKVAERALLPPPQPPPLPDFVRVVVPMAFYSHVRRVTVVSSMLSIRPEEERVAERMAKRMSQDIFRMERA